MELIFKELLMLFRSAVQGEACPQGLQSDVRVLMEQGARQQIGAVIFPAVRALYESGQTDLSADEFGLYEQAYTQVIMQQVQRQYALSQTVQLLENGGVSCCLLKGAALSWLYPVPEARISGDTDLYIGAAQEQPACDLLRQNGFTVLERPASSHHAMCKSDATGLIELHLTLYDDLFEDVWFNNLTAFDEPWQPMTTQEGYRYHVLGITDQAIFNTLHLIKHFLSEGVGIRQVMDVLLYLRHFASEINTERYVGLLKELRYEVFIAACIQIGICYLGFCEADFSAILAQMKVEALSDETVEAVLNDMASGGIFGREAEARQQFYLRYTSERYQRFKEGSYAAYIGKWNWQRIFPSRSYMTMQYDCLKRHPSWLPVLYLHRIVQKLTKPGRVNKTASQTTDGAAELEKRMQLVEQLKMI